MSQTGAGRPGKTLLWSNAGVVRAQRLSENGTRAGLKHSPQEALFVKVMGPSRQQKYVLRSLGASMRCDVLTLGVANSAWAFSRDAS